MRQAPVKQALVYAVELLLGHEEGVMLGLDVKVHVRELDEDASMPDAIRHRHATLDRGNHVRAQRRNA